MRIATFDLGNWAMALAVEVVVVVVGVVDDDVVVNDVEVDVVHELWTWYV
jgi:hypothetical protein